MPKNISDAVLNYREASLLKKGKELHLVNINDFPLHFIPRGYTRIDKLNLNSKFAK